MPPPLIGVDIKWWCCRTSVCICLTSVVYIGPKSRTERPKKTKIGTEVAHVTHDSDTTFTVKRSRSPGCFTHRRVNANNWWRMQLVRSMASFSISGGMASLPEAWPSFSFLTAALISSSMGVSTGISGLLAAWSCCESSWVQDKKRQQDDSGLQSSAQSTSVTTPPGNCRDLRPFLDWHDGGQNCRGSLHTTYSCISWAEVIVNQSSSTSSASLLKYNSWSSLAFALKTPCNRLCSPVSCLLCAAALSSSTWSVSSLQGRI